MNDVKYQVWLDLDQGLGRRQFKWGDVTTKNDWINNKMRNVLIACLYTF